MKLLAAVVAAAGFIGYDTISKLGSLEAVRSARSSALPSLDPVSGLGYAVSVPGRGARSHRH